MVPRPLPDDVEGDRQERHPDDGDERLGGVAERVDREEPEHDRGRRHPEQHDRGRGARLRPQPVAGEPDEQEHDERAGTPDRGDRGEVDEVRENEGEGCGDQQAPVLAEPRASAEDRRKLPDLRQRVRQARRAEERPVRRAGRRDQRGDSHQRETGVAERRSRSLGDRRLAVPDRLVDGERPEHGDRDEHVRAVVSPSARATALGSSRSGSRSSRP